MNGAKYLLDTCFIIGLCNGNQDVLNSFKNIPLSNCYISVINRIELLGYTDITAKDKAKIEMIISEVYEFPLSDNIANKTIQIRQQHKIKLPDSVILATAKVHNLQLLTLDKKLQKYI